MRTIRSVIAMLALLGTPWIGEAAYAQDNRHRHSSESQQISATRPAFKWETDDVVRQRMENIRHVVVASQIAIQRDRMESSDYQQLADVINENVGQIIKDSKLTQAVDAALHTVVLNDMTRSSELMRTAPKRAVQRVSALGVLQSLRLYSEYFEHPGWVNAQAQ